MSEATVSNNQEFHGTNLPLPEPPSETNKCHNITIRQVDNGYHVFIGCKSFGFEKLDSLLEKITEYMKSPDEVQKKFFEGALFKDPINDSKEPVQPTL